MTKITVYFDGASRGNPGEAGAGWVIEYNNTELEGYEFLSEKATNNQAEYTALLRALQKVEDFKYVTKETTLLIKGDSLLIIRQLKGEYAVKSPKLRPLYQQVKNLLGNIPQWDCEWIPREQNKKADAMANYAIDGYIIKKRLNSENGKREQFIKIEDLNPDPIEQFKSWFQEIKAQQVIRNPEAMTLSTINVDSAYPEGRMVILRDFDKSGFIFFTSKNSNKGKALLYYKKAALTFFWEPVSRQIRIQGDIEELEIEKVKEHFSSRPRDFQISTWASLQSSILKKREIFIKSVENYDKKYTGKDVPLPPHFSGFRLVPKIFEFWQQGINRFHDCFRYQRIEDKWHVSRIYP